MDSEKKYSFKFNFLISLSVLLVIPVVDSFLPIIEKEKEVKVQWRLACKIIFSCPLQRAHIIQALFSLILLIEWKIDKREKTKREKHTLYC